MIPYIIPLLVTLFASYRYDSGKRHDFGNKFLKFFLFIYLTLLIGFRYKVGGDSLTYEIVFSSASDLSHWAYNWMHIYQPGYTFLEAISLSITPNFYTFQLIHVFIVNSCLFIFIEKNTRYFFFTLLIIEYAIYLYFTTEILREVLAVMTFALSYPYYHKRKWLQYYICVIIAIHFHISATFLLFLPILHSIRFDRRFFIIIFVMYLSLPFLGKIISFFPIIDLSTKFESYDGLFVGYLFTFFSVLRGALFPLFYVCFIKCGSRRTLKFENLICIMILFGLASAVNPLIFGRSVNYFTLFYLISISNYLSEALRSNKPLIKGNAIIIFTLFIATYSTSYLHIHQYKRYMPYSSIFNPIEYERDHMKFESK